MKNSLLLATALFALSMPLGQAFAADPEQPMKQEVPSEDTAPTTASIEHHISYLKDKLQITPDQAAKWDKVADAMRGDVTEYEQLEQKYPVPTGNAMEPAPQSLKERVAFIELREKGEHRFYNVFSTLYDSMTPAQKTTADQLFSNGSEQ